MTGGRPPSNPLPCGKGRGRRGSYPVASRTKSRCCTLITGGATWELTFVIGLFDLELWPGIDVRADRADFGVAMDALLSKLKLVAMKPKF